MTKEEGDAERLALALEAAGLDLWENNLDTGEVPRKALKTFAELGYNDEESAFLVDDMYRLVHPEDVEGLREAVGTHLAGYTAKYRSEFRLKAKDGSWVWYANYGKIIDRADHKPGQRFIGVTFNIDDRKQKEHELAYVNRLLAEQVAERQQASALLEQTLASLHEATRAKSHFFAAISHDLRQPIHAMNLLLDVLEKAEQKEDRERLIRSIKAATGSLNGMLESLLDISKLDAGTVAPSPQVISSEDLFARIDMAFSPLALAQQLRFKIWFPPRPLMLFIDPRLLMSVLDNIVGNAFKYTEKGGVLVALRPRGAGYVFQVWDTGKGIAEPHLERIFDEYYQVDNPSRDRNRGIGLGLAIVQRLCRLLGLQLNCRSRPGRGTLFEVILPAGVRSQDSPAHAVPSAEFDTSGFRGTRLVVLEDDHLVANALSESLAVHGIDTIVHPSVEQALVDPQVHGADYYIVDHQVAGAMNGFDFLDALGHGPRQPLRAVVISGNTASEVIAAARRRALPLLVKPVNTLTILRKLHDLTRATEQSPIA